MIYRWGGILMLAALLISGCSAETAVTFSDKLLAAYPSDPTLFQQEYGGKLVFYSANHTVQEKMADIDKAIVTGSGFEVVFWKSGDFYIHHITLSANKITVGGVRVIGKISDEIIKFFGEPRSRANGVLIYQAEETEMTLRVKNGTVSYCYWGYPI